MPASQTSALSALPALVALTAALAGPPAPARSPLPTAAGPPAAAQTARIDGVSDQRLPVWAGARGDDPFAALFDTAWADGPFAQLALARYVVQWDALAHARPGASADGDYRQRLWAWLHDTRALSLVPVLALTSYTGSQPTSARAYRAQLRAILDLAAAARNAIAYVEPWNEPNGQGRMRAAAAARIADWAQQVCSARGDCQVIAGDLLDDAAAPAYERRYERELKFPARLWGIHPYVSVAARNDAGALALERALPAGASGEEVWFTEVGAHYCRDGRLLGQAAQAEGVNYLLRQLAPGLPVAPSHIFYYGFSYGHGERAPCSAPGGADTELYEPDGRPRAAAVEAFDAAGGVPAPLLAAAPFGS